jgi:hypothetical protein
VVNLFYRDFYSSFCGRISWNYSPLTILILIISLIAVVASPPKNKISQQIDNSSVLSNSFIRTNRFAEDLKVPSKNYHPSISLSAASSSPDLKNIFMQVVAGNATASGFSGDGNQATAAKIAALYPFVDGNGNIYIPDWENYKIRKVNAGTGVITTFGGTNAHATSGIAGPVGSTSFWYPWSIVGDTAASILYFSDENYVWKYVQTTNIITVFAQSTTLASGYTGDGSPASNARLTNPSGLWLTPSGVLYIADQDNHRIRKVLANGIIGTYAGNGCNAPPTCAGSFAGDGTFATSATVRMNYPRGVYMNTNGVLYIADTANNRIRFVDTNNIISTFAGSGTAGPYNGDNLPALTARIDNPQDVKGDTAGNIYIADIGHYLIRIVDNNGIMSVIFGTPDTSGVHTGILDRSSPLSTAGPWGLWVDSLSRVYFSDYNTIRRSLQVSSPTSQPSGSPTNQPSNQPSGRPTTQPRSAPSCQPTAKPSSQPSERPSTQPSRQPSRNPTMQPSSRPSK